MRQAPLRDVKRVFDVEGPRGGTIYVTMFACGHSLWERAMPKPSPQRPCMGCYVDAQVDAILEAAREPVCPGPDCARCSREYCEEHLLEPCDCDVINRHGGL